MMVQIGIPFLVIIQKYLLNHGGGINLINDSNLTKFPNH